MRDQRKYLHSTDIFEQIINLKKNSNLFDLNINFKKQINNLPFLTVNNKPSQTKQAESNVYFRFKIAKKILFGYIFQSKKKFINRRGYNEKNFQRKVRMDRKCVYIPNFDEFINGSVCYIDEGILAQAALGESFSLYENTGNFIWSQAYCGYGP